MQKLYVLLAVTGGIITACSTPQMDRVRLTLPDMRKNADTSFVNMAQQITYIDENGQEQIVTRADLDTITGEYMTSVEMEGITVMAQSKNVAERNGKVNLDFIVTVPSTLINKRWQLQLLPVAYKKDTRIELDKIFLSGADFMKMQKKGYEEYEKFLGTIIPDSLYLQMMFDSKGYRKALEELEDKYYQMWKNQMVSKEEYDSWSTRKKQRYDLFNRIMIKNRISVEGTKSILKMLPSFWMKREIDKDFMPGKWEMFLDENYRIYAQSVGAKDSSELGKRFFDIKAMAENQKKKEMKEAMFEKLVRFPYEKARLDTIIQKGDNFIYFYKQELPVDDNVKRISLTLDGQILTKEEKKIPLPPSDTLDFFISNMLSFADTGTRYKDTIISRKDEVNKTAYINYKSGKTNFDEKLGNNREELESVFQVMQGITYTGEYLIDSVAMTAAASPEGPARTNLMLSKERAENLKRYIARQSDDTEGTDTIFRPKWIGEDWNKLRRIIEKDDSLQNKRELLALFNEEPAHDQREMKMRKFTADYKRIRERMYPMLRCVEFKFYLHRRDMIQDTIHTQVVDTRYAEGYRMMQDHQYKEAMVILNEYPNDYNLGLCLMSLGYDQRALEIMKKQRETPDRNYLLAILYSRCNDEQQAVSCFMKACQKDPSKIWRGKLDPEINKLIVNYKLYQDELEL